MAPGFVNINCTHRLEKVDFTCTRCGRDTCVIGLPPALLLSVMTQRTSPNQPNTVIDTIRGRSGLSEFPSCNEELIGRYFTGFEALLREVLRNTLLPGNVACRPGTKE